MDLVNRYVTTSPWLYIKSDSVGLNASQVIEQAHMVFQYSADWKVEHIQFFPYYSYISGDRNPPPTATVPFAPSPFLLADPLAVTGSDVIVRVNDFIYDLEFGRQAEALAALADDVVVDMPDISISTSGPAAFWTDYRMALANSAANGARGGASEFYWQVRTSTASSTSPLCPSVATLVLPYPLSYAWTLPHILALPSGPPSPLALRRKSPLAT